MCRHIGTSFNEFDAFIHSLFIFSVDSDQAPSALKNCFKCSAFIDQERPCGRTHEDLDAANSWNSDGCFGCSNCFLQIADIVWCCSDEETVVADALLRGCFEFGFHALEGSDGRLVVGHVQERGDAAAYSCSRAGTQVFLFRLSRVSKVNLWVDHPRH